MKVERITPDNTCVWCWNELDGEIVDLGKAKAHKQCDDRMSDFTGMLDRVLED